MSTLQRSRGLLGPGPLITPDQVEQLLGVPVTMTFPNDYQGVHRALTFGRWADPTSELGRQFTLLAQTMLDNRPRAIDSRKRFIEFFSVVPCKYPTTLRKPAV